MQNLARFRRITLDFDREYLLNGWRYQTSLDEKMGKLWSTSKKVIGVHVKTLRINTACTVLDNATAFGSRDVIRSGISTTLIVSLVGLTAPGSTCNHI